MRRLDDGVLRTTRVLVGLALVAAGVLLLVDRRDDAADVFRQALSWWPAVLIAWAAARAITLIGPSFPRAADRSLALAALGGIAAIATGLLVATTRGLPRNWEELLPALALLGLGALLAVVQPPADRRYQNWITLSAALRRARLRSCGRDVQLVDVRAWLGQVAVDLRDARLHPAGAEVHGTVVGGSIVLRLPAGWEVVRHPVPHPSLEIVVPTPDPALRKGRAGKMEISLTGGRGSLVVDWVDAPAPRVDANPQPAGRRQPEPPPGTDART